MRIVEFIPIENIQRLDRIPITPRTLDLAIKLHSGVLTILDLPPIKTKFIGGSHIVLDGRHRVTAIKLVGLNKVKCKFYKNDYLNNINNTSSNTIF